MKFEKISDKKFVAFAKNEVINPTMIVGGKVDTSNYPNHTHDDYDPTGDRYDNYRESADGTPIGNDKVDSGG